MDGAGFNLESWLQKATHALVQQEITAIETACEKALLTGTMGVLLIRSGGLLRYAGPHPHVPYGQIYEGNLPSAESLWGWMDAFTEHSEFQENVDPGPSDPQD
jgi:hypothetical protein